MHKYREVQDTWTHTSLLLWVYSYSSEWAKGLSLGMGYVGDQVIHTSLAKLKEGNGEEQPRPQLQ